MRKPDYEANGVRLYCGDCLEILPELEAGSVDAVVTSPPYNQLGAIEPSKLSGTWGKGNYTGNFVEQGYADDMSETEYQEWQNDLFGRIGSATAEHGSLFYNHQCRWRDGELLHPVEWFRPKGWRLRQDIVWDRGGGMMFNARMFCRFDERVLWFVRDEHKWNQSAVRHGTVWRIAREQNKEHPVSYPVELPHRCIMAATDEADTVLDPFMGSASTGVAALRCHRNFIGIEKEPKYFALAVRRIEAELNRHPLFEKPSGAGE